MAAFNETVLKNNLNAHKWFTPTTNDVKPESALCTFTGENKFTTLLYLNPVFKVFYSSASILLFFLLVYHYGVFYTIDT